MSTDVAARADFTQIRYGQCWEDADILLSALNVQEGDLCVSIASAGDNSLALLASNPGLVVALDLNPAQLACLELRVAAYKELEHDELLQLMGSRESPSRRDLYVRCRGLLSSDARRFWDNHQAYIDEGIGSSGKFERYFKIFRERIMPFIHSRSSINNILAGGEIEKRKELYRRWDTMRWRAIFRIFFSRFVMGRLGRDPSFFAYVEGSVADRIRDRAAYALTELDPANNPYLHWIMFGKHLQALPFALRIENFDAIRNNIDRIEWRCQTLEDYLDSTPVKAVSRYNLSDIFEYMPSESYENILKRIVRTGRPGGRLAYWNLLVERRRPESLAASIKPLTELSVELFAQDKAFFYSAFVVEELL
jgi:S-adenosylmethionine-diacylglycerol 3-amino-3-carboxypropyl transferase